MELPKTRYTVVWHVLFWIGYLILLNSVYAGIGDFKLSFIRNFITTCFHAFLAYFNVYYLIPNYFIQQRYKRYYFFIILMLSIVTPLRVFLDTWLITDVDKMPVEFFSLPHYANSIISSLVTLMISGSFRSWQQRFKTIQLQQELKNYRLEAELKLLRTQVNPHFLFNVLNNIYVLAYQGSKETAPMIAKLSQMMRYMLASSDVEQVDLEQEIAYLHDYIALQQLKTELPQSIDFQVIGDVRDVKIAPMLFIPFFENSFKHGNIADTNKGWMKSRLSVNGKEVAFSIVNSLPIVAPQKDSVSGIGLDNVQKRLQLLYPKKHQLNIQADQKTFSIDLKLQTN